MKLILPQEVTGLGSPGDVVEVKDGYGRNYLVPRGLAIRWTKGGEKQVSSIKRAREVREVRDLDHAQEVKAKLEALRVKLPARAGGPAPGSPPRGEGQARGAAGQAAGAGGRGRPAVRLDHRVRRGRRGPG